MAPAEKEGAFRTPSLGALFGAFLKLGVTALGGPAMVPHIRRLAVEKRRWLSEQSFRAGVALCQMIPGATTMQMAAYVGLRARGAAGAVAAFVAFIIPAFALMMAFAAFYDRLHGWPPAVAAFAGLRAVIIAILAHATYTMGRAALRSWRGVAVAVASGILFAVHINPIPVILAAALLGAVAFRGEAAAVPPVNGNPRVSFPWALAALAVIAAVGFAGPLIAARGLFPLAALMVRIDLFAFGGGFASLPLMFHEFVKVRSWIEPSTFLNGMALGQITPGPVLITATFVGYMVAGPWGGIAATVAVFAPSFLLLIGITPYFDRLRRSRRFNGAVRGVLASFIGLLAAVTVTFGWDIPWELRRGLVAGGAFVALLLGARLPWVVAAGTLVSVLIL
jgi:chromate transporter